MRNALKVAKWEIKSNMKNKSFLIGLFLTPVLFLGFIFFGSLFGDSDNGGGTTQVFVQDQLGIFDSLEDTVEASELDWEMQTTDVSEENVENELESSDNTAYIFLDKRALNDGVIPVYTSEEVGPGFMNQVQTLSNPVKTLQMQQLGLSDEELAAVSMTIQFEETTSEELAAADESAETSESGGLFGEDPVQRLIPAAFAGIVLLSIVVSGMYIFQSASNEKKDKIAEIILSSVTPGELMQGKIIGYFGLGMIQAGVFLAFAIPIAVWKLDEPILEYLFVPESILLVVIAILGYFLFAALFVGVGATMADMSSAGNFQGMVMMLPFLPFIFFSPVFNEPSGVIAQIGTYIPFTTPGVLLLRLTVMEEWPWTEIIISLGILVVSIWILMKLAGKIFKTGILMYGKNATPAEIWKWIRA
ncbi:ABC-2 type transport system permease protein [Lentibacillus halodurans]|uniref:ABC-2 type transport system permease protein n=1 Tax=Lentibacillus halodurans TaxID=237679 RepID=A0A1I0X7R7_9BACI|nr:ABC transporter permease [Lentibacillus halodurans]SFA96378.1 ABC-2 type transport system permease protein [Lentibacillus halodurans]